MPNLTTERTRVNRTDHLTQHPRRLVTDDDLRMEARRRREVEVGQMTTVERASRSSA
jgi:hypothetical protein